MLRAVWCNNDASVLWPKLSYKIKFTIAPVHCWAKFPLLYYLIVSTRINGFTDKHEVEFIDDEQLLSIWSFPRVSRMDEPPIWWEFNHDISFHRAYLHPSYALEFSREYLSCVYIGNRQRLQAELIKLKCPILLFLYTKHIHASIKTNAHRKKC